MPFSLNDPVEYYSESHKQWVSTFVSEARPTGEIQVQCKPGIWMTLEDQGAKVRAPQSKGYSGRQGSTQGPWSADQAVALGPRSANTLGARKPEELTWANVLENITSVHAAVEQLNNGTVPCPEGFCIVYSASSTTHYILYKKGASVPSPMQATASSDADGRLASLEAALIQEKEQCEKLQGECDMLRAEKAAIEQRQADVQGPQQELADLRLKYDELCSTHAKLEEQFRSEEASRKYAEEKRLESQTSCGTLEAKLTEAQDELAELQASAKKEDASAELQSQLDAMKLEVLEAKAAHTKAEHQKAEAEERLQASMASSGETLRVVTVEKEKVELQLSTFEAERKGLEKQLQETSAEMDEMSSKLDIERGAKEAMAHKLTLAEDERRKAEDILKSSKADDENAEREKSDLGREREDLAAKLAALEATRADEKKAHDEEMEKALNANEVLTTARKTMEEKLRDEQTRGKDLEAELAKSKGNME